MTDTPEQPDEQTSEQDLTLEDQLDKLISELEAVEPNCVPADLRQQPENVPPVPEPGTADTPEPEPAIETPTAAEPQPVPATAEVTPPPEAPAKQELDLESVASMASNLLDQQIKETIEAASELAEADEVPPAPPEAQPIGAVTPEPAVEAAAPVADAPEPEPAGGLSEDELSDQIQALLNDVQAQSAQPAPIAETEPTPEPAPSEPEPVAATPTETAAQDPEQMAQSSAVSIEQIDAMLAESAEQAVEAGAEAEIEVPGTDEILAAQAQAEDAEAQAQSVAESEARAIEPPAEPESPPQPAQVPAEPQPALASEVGAAEVAKELDEDAQAQPAPAPEPSLAEAMQAETAEDVGVVIVPSGLDKTKHRLYHVCDKINRPLNRLSPEMRDTIGYVGVVTTALGFFVFVYGLLF